MTVTTLYVAAAIFAALALIGGGWIVLDAWAKGVIAKHYRDADVAPPVWVNDGRRPCPPRPRKHAYREGCSGR